MSDQNASSLINAPRADVIPGRLLSAFDVTAYAMAEDHFGRRHLAIAGAAADTVTDRIAQIILQTANNDVANQRFSFDTAGFRACAFTLSNLPYLLWLTLQPKHPEITLEQATAMLTADNEFRIRRAVLELIGYDLTPPPPKKTDTGKNDQPGAVNPTLGDKSSQPLENPASMTTP